MTRRNIYITFGIMITALAVFIPKRAWAGSVSINDIPLLSDAVSGTGTVKAQTRRLIAQYDVSIFGGWFSSVGRKYADIMAIFQIESNFNPLAVNRNDPSGAWGIGQVLGTTASDRGFGNPKDLLVLENGVLATMRHIKWSHDYLARRWGRAVKVSEYISAYQMGVGNAYNGRQNLAYLAKWNTARLVYLL